MSHPKRTSCRVEGKVRMPKLMACSCCLEGPPEAQCTVHPARAGESPNYLSQSCLTQRRAKLYRHQAGTDRNDEQARSVLDCMHRMVDRNG
jgi:hypothetical protein